MGRALRWIGWGFVGVAGCVALVLVYILNADSVPRKYSTAWIDGPGDSRIRSETWIKSGLRDESVVHEYTEVAADGTETPIGEGLRALDIARATIYEHGDQAELVALDRIFRRDHDGHWTHFRANDYDFVYRYYADGVTRQFGDSWYYESSGVSCWIAGLDQVKHRLVSACHYPARVRLVFRRASYDAPWVLDQSATFAESPPPERAKFPETARGTLTTLRMPSIDAAAMLERSRRLPSSLEEPGIQMLARVEFELVGTEATEVSVVTEGYENYWRARGGWVDTEGRPVVFWEDHPSRSGKQSFTERRGQPWGEAWLVESRRSHEEEASYLTYLELRSP